MNPVAPTAAGLSQVTVTLYLTPYQDMKAGFTGATLFDPFSKKGVK